MAAPPPIPGINNSDELEHAISKGVLKDPSTIEMARAAYGSPVVVNPLLAAPAPTPSPAPLGALPNVPHDVPPMPLQALAAPPPKPAPAPIELAPQHIAGPAPKPQPSPAHIGGGPAPSAPLNVVNFGKTQHEIATEQQGQKHGINQLNYQNQLSDADIAQSDQFEQHTKKIAADMDAKAKQVELSAAKRKAFLDEYNVETRAKIEEFANAKIDPGHYYAERGTAGKVTDAIAIALGGWAQGLAAGAGMKMENTALRFVEEGIQRDIEIQKAHIAKQGAGLDARKGLYGQYLQQFGNEDTAEAMAQEAYLRKAKAEIDATAAKTQNKEVKIRAQALGEALEDRIIQSANRNAVAGEKMYDVAKANEAKLRAQAAAGAANEIKKRNQSIFDANLKAVTEKAVKSGGTVLPAQSDIPLPNGAVIPAGTPIVLTSKGEIDMAGTEAIGKAMTLNVPVLQPGGGVAYSPTTVNKEGYGKASEKVAGASNAINAISEMQAASKMSGPWTGEKKKRYDQAKSNYVTAYGVMMGMGALSGADLEIVSVTIPDAPTYGVGYLSDAQIAQLENQKKVLAGQAKSTAQVYGPAETAGPAPLTTVGKPE